MKAHLVDYIQLDDRLLWADGDSSMEEEKILSMAVDGHSTARVHAIELTQNIKRYNAYVRKSEKIGLKTEALVPPITWLMPDSVAELDVTHYIMTIAQDIGISDDTRLNRIRQELDLYYNMDLVDVLRVLIHIINTFRANNVVWGVGRGSSVSSYVLFILGVHDVDSVLYDLPITDFLN